MMEFLTSNSRKRPPPPCFHGKTAFSKNGGGLVSAQRGVGQPPPRLEVEQRPQRRIGELQEKACLGALDWARHSATWYESSSEGISVTFDAS